MAKHKEPVGKENPVRYQCVGANLIGAEEEALVTQVVREKTLFRHYGFTEPKMVETLEEEICRCFGTDYSLATATGSGSYFCAAAALDFKPGDEVIIPAFGWITDYSMVRLFGAAPVFAEIDKSLNISPQAVREKITEKTKAIVVIHYQGGSARMDELVSIAKTHGIYLIEDVAQACGASFRGKLLGTWGDIACFSLQTRKMITSGDGGFLITNNQEFFEKAVRYHDLGMIRPVFEKRLKGPLITGPSLGSQLRMNELTGAAALAQFRKLPEIVKRVKKSYLHIRGRIASAFPELTFRAINPENDGGILLAFDLKTAERVSEFKEAFESQGFFYGPSSWCETMDHIDVIKQDLLHRGEYRADDFSSTEEIERRFASLAILPDFTEEEELNIAEAAIKALSSIGKKTEAVTV